MTTTPAPTEIDTAVDVAARAIQAYQARTAFPPEQYTWDAIPQEWRDRHLAAARVMVEAAMTQVLDELAEAKREIRALTDSDDAQVVIAQGERDAAREELAKTRAELEAMTERRNEVRELAAKREAELIYLRAELAKVGKRAEQWEAAYKQAEHARAEMAKTAIALANPATTAEPANEDAEDAPCKTCGKPWRNRRHECQAEPADEPKATSTDIKAAEIRAAQLERQGMTAFIQQRHVITGSWTPLPSSSVGGTTTSGEEQA